MERTALEQELETVLGTLPEAKRAELFKDAHKQTAHLKWLPSPGPQSDGYFSEADVLLWGGSPGCGKSDGVLGLAFNAHQRSLILRRQYVDLGALTERLLEINGGREGFNGAAPPSLRVNDKCLIELGAAAEIGDEQHWMGQPHDFLGVDEAAQFVESQIRFLMGWVRTVDKKQRTRVVLATNPPLTSEGLWVIQMFAPWLDPQYPRPAKPGELRWVVTDENGKDKWVDNPHPVMVGDKFVTPKSRTYIPADLKDNPYLAETGYQSQLDAMPEPFRGILLGGFQTRLSDAPNQVIPTAWIKAAQARWRPQPPRGIPMCAIGVDCTGGGRDPMVLAMRHDGWYAPLVVVPGKDIPIEKSGTHAAGIVVSRRRNQAIVVIDMGGGYGASLFEHLKANDIEVVPYRGMEASRRSTKDARLKFYNTRSEITWRFREALDPDQPRGSPIMLPDDPILLADLAAPCLDLSFNGIKCEAKEDVRKRLGRSTDHGDAVMMAWTAGAKHITPSDWPADYDRPRKKRRPIVIMKHPPRRVGR